jgi:hypothetical protein
MTVASVAKPLPRQMQPGQSGVADVAALYRAATLATVTHAIPIGRNQTPGFILQMAPPPVSADTIRQTSSIPGGRVTVYGPRSGTLTASAPDRDPESTEAMSNRTAKQIDRKRMHQT